MKRISICILLCSSLLMSFIQKQHMTKSFLFLDRRGLVVGWELELSQNKNIGQFPERKVARKIREIRGQFNLMEIITKRDSIEPVILTETLTLLKKNKYEVKNISILNLSFPEKVFNAIELKYGKLDRVKAN